MGKKSSAKRAGDGPCVHCGSIGPRTWDHLLPESWRGTSIPKRQWLIPACRLCNKNYGEIERQLRVPLSMPVEPGTPGAEGIVYSVWDSMDPSRAAHGDDRERRARVREREKLSQIIIFSADGKTPLRVTADVEMIQVMVETFVKGITWLEDKLFIDDRRYEIE